MLGCSDLLGISLKNHRIIGGEGGIRTLEGLLTLTPLAGERFRPLSHLSGLVFSFCQFRQLFDRRRW